MSNTVRMNKTVRGGAGKAHKNSLMSSKTFIAAASASITAVTMTAVIALTAAIVAPADKKEAAAPAAAAVTYQPSQTQAAAPEAAAAPAAKTTAKSVKEAGADNNRNEAVVQTAVTQKAPAKQETAAPKAAPVQKETAAPKAAPVQKETAAPQTAPVQKETAAPQTAPVQKETAAETKKTEAQTAAQPAAAEAKAEPAKQGTSVIPQGEVNDWKTHDAKDGFPIGTFYDKADTHNTLNVVKLDNTNYKITIVQPTSELSATIYNIDAEAHGAKMYYKSAVKTSVVYDVNHSITDSKVIEGTHEGTFDASDAGYTMIDTEGTMVFIPWVGYR